MPSQTVSQSLRALQKRRKKRIRFVAVMALAFLFFFQSSWELEAWVHESIEDAGIALLIVCILGRTWCTLYIGGKKAHELVDLGPYSLSRNPLYVFSFVGALGIGLQSGSLIIGGLFLLVCIAVFLPVIKGEEAALAILFGPAFDAYKARVPRFLPKWSAWREADSLTISTRLLYITLRDGLVFASLIPLFEVIDWLQMQRIVPVLISLP